MYKTILRIIREWKIARMRIDDAALWCEDGLIGLQLLIDGQWVMVIEPRSTNSLFTYRRIMSRKRIYKLRYENNS